MSLGGSRAAGDMARSGIIRQHVEPVAQPPPRRPPIPRPRPPTERGDLYAGESPVYGVDYEEDGRYLSQNSLHDSIVHYTRSAIEQHCSWLDTFDNFLRADVQIVYKEAGKTVTIAPDVLLAKGWLPKTRPRSSFAGEPRHAPRFRLHRPPSYVLADEGKPPDFVLEVVSPKNSLADLRNKRAKYLRIGVPEYFEFDPNPKQSNPPLKRYRLQPGGKAWQKETSRTGLRSRELNTDIQVNGDRLIVLDPKRSRPYERPIDAKERADREEERADREEERANRAEARANSLERELNKLRRQLQAPERAPAHSPGALVTAARHSDEARQLGPPDIDAGPGGALSRPVELPDREVLTVAYEAGPLRRNFGERMIARGPRDLVRKELLAHGYTIQPGRRRPPPPGR